MNGKGGHNARLSNFTRSAINRNLTFFPWGGKMDISETMMEDTHVQHFDL